MPRTRPPANDADRYALSLLDHDGLMTPRLVAEFGPLRAIQTSARVEGDIFHRQSILRTLADDEALLEADLKISLSALPDGFLGRLQTTQTPFGQLLMDYAIAVRFSDRQIYQHLGKNLADERWGRRLAMWHADTGGHLCDVQELLFPAKQLFDLPRRTRP
jgi:chorismate-pyruvate lyase